MCKTSKVLIQFLIYSAGALILRLITASSILITIKFITPAQFGFLALLNNLMVFLPILLGLGLRQVLAIEFFRHPNPWDLVWDLVMVYLLWAIAVITILILNLTDINKLLFFNQIHNKLLLLALITSWLNFFPELLFQLLRFQNKALNLATIQISMGAILAAITIYLLKFCDLGLPSVIWAQLITQFLATSYFVYLLFINRFTTFSFILNSKKMIGYLKIGLPFVPNIIFAWLILACNRWLLNWQLANLEEVGIYSLAENISLMFQALVAQPIMHSFLPYAFQHFAQASNIIDELDRQYTRWAYYLIIGCVITMPSGFVVLKPILCYLLPVKYLAALPLIIPLLIAQAIFAATHLTSASLQYRKKTHVLAFLMAGGAFLAILLNLWLIPIYGPWACVIATNCAYLAYFGLIQAIK